MEAAESVIDTRTRSKINNNKGKRAKYKMHVVEKTLIQQSLREALAPFSAKTCMPMVGS